MRMKNAIGRRIIKENANLSILYLKIRKGLLKGLMKNRHKLSVCGN